MIIDLKLSPILRIICINLIHIKHYIKKKLFAFGIIEFYKYLYNCQIYEMNVSILFSLVVIAITYIKLSM